MIFGFGGTTIASSKCLKKEVSLLFTLLFKHFQRCPTINHPFLGGNMGKPHWLILFGDDLSCDVHLQRAVLKLQSTTARGDRLGQDSWSTPQVPWILHDFAENNRHQSHHLQQIQDSPTAPKPHLSGQRRTSTPGPVRDTSSQLGSSNRLNSGKSSWMNHP